MKGEEKIRNAHCGLAALPPPTACRMPHGQAKQAVAHRVEPYATECGEESVAQPPADALANRLLGWTAAMDCTCTIHVQCTHALHEHGICAAGAFSHSRAG